MKVKLTVVGIRHCLPNGDKDYPALFKRLPVGSIVYLRKEPTGSQYPGSITVLDTNSIKLGSIAKTERRFIELEIPEDRMLAVKICGHSKENNCMYVTAETTQEPKQPYIRKIKFEDGETIFPTTEHDRQLQNATALLKTKLKAMLKEDEPENIESIKATAEDYIRYCGTSLDGESSFSRSDILIYLTSLTENYPELEDVYKRIFDIHKDLGKDEVMTKVYEQQYARIKKAATTPDANGSSQLDDYIARLKFANGGNISEKIIEDEIMKFSVLLSNEMEKSYVKQSESSYSFAKALYSLNYSLNATYTIYTRQIKLDYLKQYDVVGDEEDKQFAEDLKAAFIKQEYIPEFIKAIDGKQPKAITRIVVEYVDDGKINQESRFSILYGICTKHKRYNRSVETWNKQVKDIKISI